jgi:hypothetical protein
MMKSLNLNLNLNQNKDRRDIVNFITLRQAHPRDDLALGEFLVTTFRTKQNEKNPDWQDSAERIIDLLNVKDRRENGVVLIYELGYQIIGTFSVICQQAAINTAWLPNSTMLRCIAVAPSFHGLSLSKEMLQEVDRISLRMGATHCCLQVNELASSVAQLYIKSGYNRDFCGDAICSGVPVHGYYKVLSEPAGRDYPPSIQSNIQ